MEPKTILGVFAHPDDESMGPGGTLAKYAAAGHRVAFYTVTEGGAGRLRERRPDDEGGREGLRRVRREETVRAAGVLGIESLGFLGWPDGGLHERDVLDLEVKFASLFRRERPDVVVTFHGAGISYHRDHRIVTLAAMGAVLGSGREGWYREAEVADLPPHAPAKLYGFTANRDTDYWAEWPRDVYASPASEITTFVDTRAFEETKWKAILAHASQQNGPPFRVLYEAGAFREECFVRIFPSPAPGAAPEADLLEGLD